MRKILLGVLGLLLVVVVGGYFFVESTHLKPGGNYAIPTLTESITIEEDANGVPTLSGNSLPDLIRAQGWIVARERLFQMDLIRRRSAGRLSEVFGKGALESDKLRRTYGYVSVAEKAKETLLPEAMELLEAFSHGVNAYIQTGPLPLEMRAIGYKPYPWTPADSMMVAVSMYDPPPLETNLQLAATAIPGNALKFFTPQFGLLDSPILADPSTPPLPLAPLASELDWRQLKKAAFPDVSPKERDVNGSNAWAISGKHTKTGKPLLAGDPHLGLGLPNIWFRLKLKGPDFEVTGVTIPGIPGILIGSNGDVAWTFTNAMADTADLIPVSSPAKAGVYLVDGKETAFTERKETIVIKGESPETITVRETIWGPVIEDAKQPHALQWVALDPKNYVRLDMTHLNKAKDLPSAFRALELWNGPPHNAVLASRDGHIGWTVVGNIPNRVGFDGSLAVPRDRGHYWKGYIPFAQLPKIVDPASGFIVSANQRTMPYTDSPLRFSNDWAPPARALRLQTELVKKSDWTADSSYQLQLDTYSPLDVWYRDQLLKAVSSLESDPWSKAIFELANTWDGKLSVESSGYVFMREFRKNLFKTFLAPVLAKFETVEQREAVLDSLERDEWVAALLEQKPLHLLGSDFANYEAAVRAAALKTATGLVDSPDKLKSLRWGNVNRTEINHPFSLVLPKWAGGLVNIPATALPGGRFVARAGSPRHAASIRMVVDLSDRKTAIFNQPGGQSGYLFSSNYADQFPAWIQGKPANFEPGAPLVKGMLTP